MSGTKKKKKFMKFKPRQIGNYLRFCPGLRDSTPYFSIQHATAQRLHVSVPNDEWLNSSGSFILELHIRDECDGTAVN